MRHEGAKWFERFERWADKSDVDWSIDVEFDDSGKPMTITVSDALARVTVSVNQLGEISCNSSGYDDDDLGLLEEIEEILSD